MKKLIGPATVLATLLLCSAAAFAATKTKMVYRANLRGTEELPTRITTAHGNATFILNKDMTEIRYRVTVTNMKNVTEAHIHIGAPAENGAPVVMLYGPSAPGGGRKSGVLSSGTIQAADLTGPLAGKTIQDLLAEMNSGHTYVNVHSNDGVGEANSGPGDFPDGEIRGQIK